MDFDITQVRKLTAKRNHPDTPPHLKQQLTNILQTGENINAASPGTYRDELIASFKRQWTKYEADSAAA